MLWYSVKEMLCQIVPSIIRFIRRRRKKGQLAEQLQQKQL